VAKPSYPEAVQDGHERRHDAWVRAVVQAAGRAAQVLLVVFPPVLEQLTAVFT